VIKLRGIGHVNLRVADHEASKRFYRDVLGFAIAEEDPDHGGVFMTLGDNFHTLDIGQHPAPESAQRPQRGQIGLGHIAFQVGSYAGLRRLCPPRRQRRRDPARHQPHQPAQLLFRRSRRQHPRNLLRAAARIAAVPRRPGRPGRGAESQRARPAVARLAARGLAAGRDECKDRNSTSPERGRACLSAARRRSKLRRRLRRSTGIQNKRVRPARPCSKSGKSLAVHLP